MHSFDRLFRRWPALLVGGAALGALALLWGVRDMPLQPAPFVRIDALSAFMLVVLFGGLALALGAQSLAVPSRRAALLAAVLTIGAITTLTPVIAGAYLGLALLTLPPRSRMENRGWLQALGRAIRAAPDLLAAASLLVGYGALALRGALRYDDRLAGAALDSFVFWFVLLAAVVPYSILALRSTTNPAPPLSAADRRSTEQQASDTSHEAQADRPPVSRLWSALSRAIVGRRWSSVELAIFRTAWLYPLVRLYSLGPWNNGWTFATLLLAGSTALWAAATALTLPAQHGQHTRILLSHLGLVLAALGLGTSTGIAAGCYGLLAYLVLVVGREMNDRRPAFEVSTAQPPISDRQSPIPHLPWLLSGAVPFTAPFVVTWMLIGAGVAGGVALLSGVAWLTMLLNALATALAIAPVPPDRHRALVVAAATSALLGIGAPLVVLVLIQPVIEQLQGGLTPYGDVNIWPWVGLETIDSAHQQVTTLPSIAVAGLMLVLAALVYLIVRLRETAPPQPDETTTAEATPADPLHRLSTLIAGLRADVPWLGGAEPEHEEPQGERE